MRLVRSLVFLAACAIAMHAQTRLSVGYQKRVEIALSGATAAYSLDSSIADASASDGLVVIVGKAPGTTNIIIVTSAGVQTLPVVVPIPPPTLPPGFEPPAVERQGESGSYEFRYNSEPGQITNSVEMKRVQGESFDRLQFVNANLFSATGNTSAIGFPYLSYEISRPHRDMTFVDQTVNNSPFTLDEYMVRGFHLREGDWQFHGGFTSVATFQGLFLATDREYVVGGSRTFRLDSKSSVEGNVYYFRNPDSLLGGLGNGVAGTLAFRYVDKDRAHFLTEWGFSHGVGLAMRGGYNDEKTHFTGSFRTQPQSFASLAVNNQRGTFGEGSVTRKLGSRCYASADFNDSDFKLPFLRQNTLTTGGLLNFKLNRNFQLNGGATYSTFESKLPAAPRVRNLNVPAGINFSSRHFGAGFEYQRATSFDGSGGNDYSVNLRGSAGNFNAGVFARHDVQVPTLAAVFSSVPGLEDALERAGFVALTPDQLAELLRNSALLASLGFTTPLTVDLAPSRNDIGATLNWMSRSPSRRQVDFNFFNSDTRLVVGDLRFTSATLSYAQRLTNSTQIVGSAAVIRTANNGPADTKPLFSVSLRHQFYSVPGFIMPGRHGVIEGHVFRDDESSGRFTQQQPVEGVEIRLDGDRVTHSDAHGFYSFHHVPYGVHRVEAKFLSAEPFFYTTDSPATSDINNTVDFGINFAKGQVFGFLLNDAGLGVTGVSIELRGDKTNRQIATAGGGKFTFPGLPAGNYTISTVPESYPPGYSLQGLEPQQLTVDPGKPARVQFTAKALRSIAGKVLIYDKASLQPVPLPGINVRLEEAAPQATNSPAKFPLETTSAETGAYIFRNLPAGTYVIKVEYESKETAVAVTVPPEPSSLKNIDLNVGSK